ncbi:hypothetical protein EON64_18240 [archaeon]|nr:MAG: hypothetical protein EON64_18240 [archaeon]
MGFVHGVLNTDNMSLLGLTIDYGPFGFLEQFDPAYTPNGSDSSARYAYSEQPAICRWNLGKLAEALVPLLPAYRSTALLARYDTVYQQHYLLNMRRKLGLLQEHKQDAALVADLFGALQRTRGDFTDSFVALTEFQEQLAEGGDEQAAKQALLDKLVGRSPSPGAVANQQRRKTRIHWLSMAPAQITMLWDALQGDGARAKQLFGDDVPLDALRQEVSGEKRKLDLLQQTGSEIRRLEAMDPTHKAGEDMRHWAVWLDAYYARLEQDRAGGEEAKSGHRGVLRERAAERLEGMRASNPTLILRSWMAQRCIEQAEKGDYSYTRQLLGLLSTPFDPALSSFRHNPLPQQTVCSLNREQGKGGRGELGQKEFSDIEREFLQLPPEWADSLLCTCSS